MLVEYVLYGGGDFAVEVATYLRDIHGSQQSWSISHIVALAPPRLDDFEAILGSRPQFVTDASAIDRITAKAFVICVGDAALRVRAIKEVLALGAKLASVVHPLAYVASSASIGDGAIICPFAFVGPFASVGRCCAVNVGAMVGHDVQLGDGTVLSPGAKINGRGNTGEAAFLGAGAVITPKVRLGSYAKLAAGSVLNKSAGDGFLMHGNPASGRQMIRVPATEN